MRRAGLLLGLALVSSSAAAKEPRAVATAKQVKPHLGAVRLSVQSQTQQMGKLYMWFLRQGDDPAGQEVLRFERGSGVPLAGTNMIDSKPQVYALPPGFYYLIAHGVKCSDLPPFGTSGCSVAEGALRYTAPASRYTGPTPTFQVVAGQLTDAGEFILEAAPDSPMTEGEADSFAQNSPWAFNVRVRASNVPAPASFSSMGSGPAPFIPHGFESAITCAKRPKGAMMYLPFQC